MHEEWTPQDTSDFLNLAVCNWALKEVTHPHFDYLAKPPKLQIIFIFCSFVYKLNPSWSQHIRISDFLL